MSEESSTKPIAERLRDAAYHIENNVYGSDEWARLMREAASIIASQDVVTLLERFRERCAEEGTVGCDRDHSANNPADHIRAIDVAAWLASTRKGG